MEILEFLHVIRKRFWLVFVITAAALLGGILISKFVMKPVYEAKVTLIIGRTPSSQYEKINYDDILAYQKLIKTYSELAKSRIVAEETIMTLKYNMECETLQGNLKVAPKGDTQILEVAVQDRDQDRVVEIANTLSSVFVNKVKTMLNADDIKIMDMAKPPASMVKPNLYLNTAFAGFAGLIISFSLAFLLEHLDGTLKTEDDIEGRLGINVLASIPYIKITK